MIVSMININSGGRTRLSGITASWTSIFHSIRFITNRASSSAATGVMMMVVIGTFWWSSYVAGVAYHSQTPL